jgi:hypothetical protein
MRLFRIDWPDQWTSDWPQVITLGNMPWLPALPVTLQITMVGGETLLVTAVARTSSGDLVCEAIR